MSDVVKGILAGGWSLLVGWVLPAVLNMLLLAYVVLPASPAVAVLTWLDKTGGVNRGVAVTGAGVLFGVLLASAQTPLYRLLEGYFGWKPPRQAAPEPASLGSDALAGPLAGTAGEPPQPAPRPP